jgi:ABC-type transporter Mla MlaB component
MGSTAPPTVAFAIRGPINHADLPGLCERVCTLLGDSRAAVALCDVRGVEPDAGTVDALARLQLAARRYACQVRLRHASEELLELVAFMGLSEVLPDPDSTLGVKPGREAEEREQRLGVEEERELGNSAV